MKKLLITLLAVSLSTVTYADEDTSTDGGLILSFFGAAHDTVADDNGTKANEYSYGFGGFVEANVNGFLGIETGAVLLDKQYESEAPLGTVVQETSRLHVPVMVKFWITDYFSLGAGAFASFKIGDTSTTFNVGGVNLGTINSSADEDVEFGYDLSATFNLAIQEKTGLFIEGRYSSLFDEENSENADELYALAGVKIEL